MGSSLKMTRKETKQLQLSIHATNGFIRHRKTLPKGDGMVIEEASTTQRKSMDKMKPSRSNSIDSGVCLSPPPTPQIFNTTAALPSMGLSGQHGASLAFSFILEQEIGIEKLKLE